MSTNIRVGSRFKFFPGTSAHRQFPYTYYISHVFIDTDFPTGRVDKIRWKCTQPRLHSHYGGDKYTDVNWTGEGMNYRKTFESTGDTWSVCFLQDNRKEFTDEEYESLLV